MRANAVFDLAVGLLLLSGTWDGLFDALDLPRATPPLFAQVGGAALVAFAYLLWTSVEGGVLQRRVAAAAAGANALSAAVIVVWLINGGLGIDALGKTLLVLAAVLLGLFAAAQARIARSA